MTLPSGPADKLGNLYEKWWTVSQCVRMLHGDTEAIRIEDPGIEKAEFVVTAGSRRELHQAERSHRSGKWSLATLGASDVQLLQTIGAQLAGNSDRSAFASGSDARELSELCESAGHAKSVEEFGGAFLAALGQKELVEQLACRRSGHNPRCRDVGQHQNDEWTTRSLDLIDRLCLERIAEGRDDFEQFER